MKHSLESSIFHFYIAIDVDFYYFFFFCDSNMEATPCLWNNFTQFHATSLLLIWTESILCYVQNWNSNGYIHLNIFLKCLIYNIYSYFRWLLFLLLRLLHSYCMHYSFNICIRQMIKSIAHSAEDRYWPNNNQKLLSYLFLLLQLLWSSLFDMIRAKRL